MQQNSIISDTDHGGFLLSWECKSMSTFKQAISGKYYQHPYIFTWTGQTNFFSYWFWRRSALWIDLLFLSSGMSITLLRNWFLIYKLGRNFCNKWCVLKPQIFESQFLTLMWTVMATGLLGTARAKRTSKVQNNKITEEEIIEQKI